LVDRLNDHPDLVHLVEDVEEAVRDPQAMGVLKSALWGTRRNREGRLERWITWNAHGVQLEFLFSGGVCMTSNLELRSLPKLAALKTRICWLDLRVTDEEVAAKMRQIALDGFPKDENLLDPEQCWEVAEFAIAESAKISRRLDLRLLINSFEDRLQSEDLQAGLSWRDLVASRIRERPSITEPVQSLQTRSEKKSQQLEIAWEVVGLGPDERLRVWQAKVPAPGNSRATLYRRLNELTQADAVDFD
jgi:hypothetical protein